MKNASLLSLIFFSVVLSGYSQQSWERFYDGQKVETFCMTADNEFVLPGIRWEGMLTYMEIIRTDTLGYVVWDTIFFYPSTSMSFIHPTADSGFLLSGSEGLMMRFDKNNHLLWQNEFDLYHPKAVCKTPDGGFMIAGFRYNMGSYYTEAFVMELTSTGDSLWSKTDFGYSIYEFYQILSTSDGGYYLTADMNSDRVLLKCDEDLNVVWMEEFDFSSYFVSVIELAEDNGVFAAGYPDSGYGDVSFVKLNSLGEYIWMQSIENENYNDFRCKSISADHDGGLVAAITVEDSDNEDHIWILKLGDQGDSTWSVDKPDVVLDISKIITTPDSMYVFHGVDLVRSRLVKMDPADGSIITGVSPQKLSSLQKPKAYPNPFNDELRIVLPEDESGVYSLMDITGRKIMTGSFSFQTELLLNTGNLKAGIYLYEILVDQKVLTEKVVKE